MQLLTKENYICAIKNNCCTDSNYKYDIIKWISFLLLFSLSMNLTD